MTELRAFRGCLTKVLRYSQAGLNLMAGGVPEDWADRCRPCRLWANVPAVCLSVSFTAVCRKVVLVLPYVQSLTRPVRVILGKRRREMGGAMPRTLSLSRLYLPFFLHPAFGDTVLN